MHIFSFMVNFPLALSVISALSASCFFPHTLEFTLHTDPPGSFSTLLSTDFFKLLYLETDKKCVCVCVCVCVCFFPNYSLPKMPEPLIRDFIK